MAVPTPTTLEELITYVTKLAEGTEQEVGKIRNSGVELQQQVQNIANAQTNTQNLMQQLSTQVVELGTYCGQVKAQVESTKTSANKSWPLKDQKGFAAVPTWAEAEAEFSDLEFKL